MQADLLGKTLNILIGYTRQKIIKNLEKRLKKKRLKKKYHWQIPSIILLVFLIHRVFVIGPCKKILARKLRGEGILKTIHLGLFNKFY